VLKNSYALAIAVFTDLENSFRILNWEENNIFKVHLHVENGFLLSTVNLPQVSRLLANRKPVCSLQLTV